jgi:hypothetical protein
MKAKFYWIVLDPKFVQDTTGRSSKYYDILAGPFYDLVSAYKAREEINTPAVVVMQVVEMQMCE